MKKKFFFILIMFLGFLSACGNTNEKTGTNSEDTSEKKEIIIGFGVGSYEEQFRESILPILEGEGYKVEIKTFSQNTQINSSMLLNEIDASVFQSTAYMESINKQENGEMIKIAYVPSAPQGLYSNKHDSVNNIKDGMKIALPQSPTSLERAAQILSELGWATIDEDAEIINFSINDLKPGKYNLEFIELDLAQILVSLDDVDFGIVNGNFITDSGRKITDALKIEDMPDEHRIIVSINKEDENEQWAQDLKAAYESSKFEDYIKSKEIYDGFVFPEAWETN